ncbi:unnamed protein product [Effrenium voratum]|nr:unnamed protein product [Effrenium voratum]
MHQGHEFEERETEIVWTSSRYYSFKMALAPQRYLPSQQGLTLLYAGEQLKGDRQVVLAAVQQQGCALLFASDSMRSDRAVVLQAIQQNGMALQHASEELQMDKDLIVEAGAHKPHLSEKVRLQRNTCDAKQRH